MPHFLLPEPLLTRLERALNAAGEAVSPQDALEILAGLNGCPQQGDAIDNAVWPRLFAPEPDDGLVAVLVEDSAEAVEPAVELSHLRTESPCWNFQTTNSKRSEVASRRLA